MTLDEHRAKIRESLSAGRIDETVAREALKVLDEIESLRGPTWVPAPFWTPDEELDALRYVAACKRADDADKGRMQAEDA